MEEIKVIVEKFEHFIKRSVLPSASFMLFFLLYDVLFNNKLVINFLDKEHSQLTIGLIILAFIGLTNLLSILQQAIYDNRLKSNFNGSVPWKNENIKLNELREKVNTQLGKNENDYMLYKIIGKDMDTREYVNQSKSFGIMFVSLMMVSSIGFITSLGQLTENINISTIFISFLILIFIALMWYIGGELVKSRYRSRAIKIYTNYLNKKESEK